MRTFVELNSQLIIAIENHNLEQIRQILELDSKHQHFFYYEVLETDFLEDSEELLLSILEKFEINPNYQWEGITLIVKATRRGFLKIVDKLVELGANVNNWTKQGNYPCSTAAQAGDLALLTYCFPLTYTELLAWDFPILLENLKKQKIRHCFAFTHLVNNVAHKLVNVKRHANLFEIINLAEYPQKEAALWMAAYWGDELLAETLLLAATDCNAQIDFRPFAGDSLKYLPWKTGISPVDREGKGIPPRRAKYQALTPIMVAIASGAVTQEMPPSPKFSHLEVIRLLIRAAADLDLQDCDGYTALIWATLLQWSESVEILLKSGANPNLINQFGYSALMLATYLRNCEIITLLRQVDASTQSLEQIELIHAIEDCDLSRVETFLNAGINPNAMHYLGDTALKLAITKQRPDICKSLVQEGANLDAIDFYQNESAFLCAVRHENVEIIHLLIEAKANPNIRGKFWGETALIEAVRYCNLEIVKLLVQYGADLNIRDNFGRTALDYVDMPNDNCSVEISTEIGILLMEAVQI